MGNRLLREMRKLCTALNPVAANHIMYFALMKKRLNLKKPSTFNEKINWLKFNVFPKDPVVVRCSDKIAVREYLREKNSSDLLNELYGTWNTAEEIDWDSLPNQFVLKCNHGCGYNIICADKSKFNKDKAMEQLNSWLKEDFWKVSCEPHYKQIPHQILCERYLGKNIVDYKFFCFDGKPLFFYVSQNNDGDFHDGRFAMFDLDGNYTSFQRADHKQFEEKPVLPVQLQEMIEVCGRLSADFPFVRVDLFVIEGKIYFSELTFTPCSGMMPLTPESADAELGKKLNLERYCI